ncbi:MAG TPA: hotdog fold domain-containing protein [Solirubrobacterales bacterium]|nr:hotdog fold domain-containing protein [Solirubrobacterales bacterium]
MPNLTAPQTTLIEDRFQGIPDVAHGGYVAGALAAALDTDSVEVQLRRPIPTGCPLDLKFDGETLELRDGEALLARASRTALQIETPSPVSFAEAEMAARDFIGADQHPIPGCLVCGTHRHRGDGLRIFPGPVAGRGLVAAPWVPDTTFADDAGHVPGALASAALDCTQLWALIAHAPPGIPDKVVTASLELSLGAPVLAGEPHVVLGWPIGRDGRSWLAGAAVVGPGGEICALGRQRAAITDWGVPLGFRPTATPSQNHSQKGEDHEPR